MTRLNSKEYLKPFMIKWDRNIWEDELEMKTSLQIYPKMTLTKKKCMTSSTILYKARTNTLQLNDRNRHTNEEIHCLVCDTDDKEDIYHLIYVTLCCIQRTEKSKYTPTTTIFKK